MITTLFSPAETKRHGGTPPPFTTTEPLFGRERRREILDAYRAIIASNDPARYLTLFGLKKASDAAPYLQEILDTPTRPAVERYSGVAYDYLDLASLDSDARSYLESRLIIFSNLFGPLRGGDRIPDYKVKQGNRVGEIAPERFYRTAFQAELDTLLEGQEILDLRAGYYDKFYKPAQSVTTMKFIKEGKVVSHWAKAYRGLVLRHLAQHRFETIAELLASEMAGVRIKEIVEKRAGREVVYEIMPLEGSVSGRS